MCKILEKIRGKSAEELLAEYEVSIEPPINISELLNKIGISTVADEFTEVEDECGIPHGTILGAVFSQEKELIIFYRKADPLHRKKFTIAHELAHCCYDCPTNETSHVELRLEPYKGTPIKLTQDEYEKEKRANIFAGTLLIPRVSLMKVYNEMLIPSLKELARIFDVSSSVMAARLDYLKLSYYKDVETEIML